MMSLERLDASHLVTLHVLLEERHVTRAAKRLGVTQSSMSHRLQRLRESFGDELLVRDGARLVPTARAAALAPRLGEALRQLEAVVAPPQAFDPKTSTATLTLVMPDLLAPALPALLGTLSAAAPAMTVRVWPVTPELPAQIAAGPLTLALSPTGFVPEQARSRPLGALTFHVAGRRRHPLWKKRLTVARWLSVGHVVVHVGNDRSNVVAEALRTRKLARRVALEVPSFLAGLHVVAASDLLMNVPVPLVNDVAAALDLVVRPAPVPLPSVPFALLWHERFQHDEAHRWARDVVADAIHPLLSRPPSAAR